MTGNKTLDNAILGLSLLMSCAALGVIIYTTMVFKKPLPDNAIEQANLMESAEKGLYTEAYKIDKLIVNLKSRTSRLRFLDVQAYLVPFKTRYRDMLEEKKPMINDVIIDEAAKLEPNDLNTVYGKIIFESRIKKGINALFKYKVVKDIQFSKFVVQ